MHCEVYIYGLYYNFVFLLLKDSKKKSKVLGTRWLDGFGAKAACAILR